MFWRALCGGGWRRRTKFYPTYKKYFTINLSDDGFITITKNFVESTLSISNVAIFAEINTRRSALQLSLKEQAALGIFFELAEEVVFKIVRFESNFEKLFGYRLLPESPSTALDIATEFTSTRVSPSTSTYFIAKSIDTSGIFQRLHKEINQG